MESCQKKVSVLSTLLGRNGNNNDEDADDDDDDRTERSAARAVGLNFRFVLVFLRIFGRPDVYFLSLNCV